MNKRTIPKIIRIFWKRTYLFIEYSSDTTQNLYIDSGQAIIYPKTKQITSDTYRTKINICVQEEREMLPCGTWQIYIGNYSILDITDNVLYSIEELSRVFRYDYDKAYIVTFHLSGDKTEQSGLSFRVDYMKTNRIPKKRFDSLFLAKKILNIYYKVLHSVYFNKGNRVMFLSENKDEMSGNLRAIYDRMIERKLDHRFKIDCIFENIVIKKNSFCYWIKLIFKIAKADYIFVEDYVPVFSFLKLNKNTCLVQTWHAGFGFKSVGYGRFGLKGSPNPYQSCHRKYTYALVGNEHLREVYTEVFGIPQDVLLATGMPKLDTFLDKKKMLSNETAFYSKYPHLREKRIMIFAPTYRGNNQKEAFYDFDRIDQDALYEYCKNNNMAVIFKFHYFISNSFIIKESYRDLFFDMSESDLHTLFYIGDILVTDYSSCFYEYILLEKPIIFYIYDEAFFSASRGVHRKVSKIAPGKVVRSFRELIACLENKDYEIYNQDKISKFLIDKCKTNGNYKASDKVIDFILLNKEVEDICIK